jgi:hypothetical protein
LRQVKNKKSSSKNINLKPKPSTNAEYRKSSSKNINLKPKPSTNAEYSGTTMAARENIRLQRIYPGSASPNIANPTEVVAKRKTIGNNNRLCLASTPIMMISKIIRSKAKIQLIKNEFGKEQKRRYYNEMNYNTKYNWDFFLSRRQHSIKARESVALSYKLDAMLQQRQSKANAELAWKSRAKQKEMRKYEKLIDQQILQQSKDIENIYFADESN